LARACERDCCWSLPSLLLLL